MNYLLGIDLGTSYFKFGVYGRDSTLKGLVRLPLVKDTDSEGTCEVPVKRFIKIIKDGIARVCSEANILQSQIGAIGYSSQANSFLLLDDDFKPLTPLILWTDNRYPEIHAQVKELWQNERFQQTTGIGIEATSNLCINKLAWLRNTNTGIWNRVKHVMTISDYLCFLFTNQKVGDFGTASLLGLLDCENRRWWPEAFDILELNEAMFSERIFTHGKIGKCRGMLATEAGIISETDFYSGSLDHHMAAIGAGLVSSDEMSISIGTVLACVNFADVYEPRKQVCISSWGNEKYCQLTFDPNGAAALEWYHKNFAAEMSFDELINMAENMSSTDGLTAVPVPSNCKNIYEVFRGINKNHNHGHFILALMNLSANTLAELIRKLSPEKKPQKIYATGGGAKNELWLDIIAKITGIKVIASQTAEPAAFGSIKPIISQH